MKEPNAGKVIINYFPEFVKKLPKADYSRDGTGVIKGFVVEGKNHQVVFNENNEAEEFTPHTPAASFGGYLLRRNVERAFGPRFYSDHWRAVFAGKKHP